MRFCGICDLDDGLRECFSIKNACLPRCMISPAICFTNARYTKLPLKEFVENYNAGNGAEVFSQCVDRYFYGKDVAISAKLTAQQQKYIEDFWHNLSALNTEQFVGHVEYYGNYFAQTQSEKLRKECADKASLGPKLGILIGAIVGLMLM